MHGPWHPILHNAPRPLKNAWKHAATSEHAPIIPNDYSWYRPLNKAQKEIRILFLEPEPLDSPKDVVVHVFNASMLDPTVPELYGCLSYSWGSPKETKPIEINYTEKSDSGNGELVTTKIQFQVTVNLEAALRVLRNKLVRPVMWVDALCIDQSDLAERSSQVSLMSEIYTQAVQTVIWLGNSDSTTKAVFDFADFITTMERKADEIDPNTMAGGIKCRRLRPLAKGELNFTEEEVTSDAFYKMRWGVQSVLARPFFRRAWVLQEIGLADIEKVVLYCGEHFLRWQIFQNLTSFEWRAAAYQGPLPIDSARDIRLGLPLDNPSIVPGAHYTLPEIWAFLRRCSLTKRGKILEFMFRRLEIQATDPRDHIIALFGLAQECQGNQDDLHPGFRPDYTKSIAEVYTLFTRAVIGRLGHLIVLSAIDGFQPSPTRAERDIPSWVPEYDRHINLRRTLGFLGQGEYKASGTSKPYVTDSIQEPNILRVAGISLDTITAEPLLMQVHTANVNNIYTPARLSVGISDSTFGIHALWHTVKLLSTPSRLASLLEPFILTLICSRHTFFNRPLIILLTELPTLFADFAAYWVFEDPDISDLPAQTAFYASQADFRALAETGHAGKFAQRLFYTCHERSFVFTGEGRLALVPRGARKGDKIVICEGANVPYLARRIDAEREGENDMEFLGDCYVHGVMRGEAWGDAKLRKEFLHFV